MQLQGSDLTILKLEAVYFLRIIFKPVICVHVLNLLVRTKSCHIYGMRLIDNYTNWSNRLSK